MGVIFLNKNAVPTATSGEVVQLAQSQPPSLVVDNPPWSTFVAYLLNTTADCIELRAIKPEGGAADTPLRTRDPSAITDFCLTHNSANHVYVGAATRLQSGGTKEHCREAIWAWADIDFKDFSGGEAEAGGRLGELHYPPSIVVNTGGGLHCYWLLTAPVQLVKHGKRFEQALRRIAHNLGADTNRAELASMMRMPGTRNMKPERHGYVTSVVKMDLSLKYELDAFLSLPLPPSAGHSSLEALASGIVKGNRDAGALAYVNAVIKRKGPDTDDEALLLAVKELLLKAGGDGLDAIIGKIPGWIGSAHALFDNAEKPTALALADAIKAFHGGLVACVGGQVRIYREGYWPLADEFLLRNQIAELSCNSYDLI